METVTKNCTVPKLAANVISHINLLTYSLFEHYKVSLTEIYYQYIHASKTLGSCVYSERVQRYTISPLLVQNKLTYCSGSSHLYYLLFI